MGRRTLINKKISSQEESSSSSKQFVNLEDIPEESPLYGHVHSYLASQKQQVLLLPSPERILMITNSTKITEKRNDISFRKL
ncbi:hypothetical protein H5410_004746 [Solanum commersonii]|uniref:Uncharacterized protein n=1 Tax=Solanum commersonii TaxID=4109 RepID=A0A9J6A574_SOLCO|nr:hypothetical protein H5410_004746 [Solanum commersonii]